MRSSWTTMASLMFMCSRKDGRMLIAYLAPEQGMLDQWHSMFLETSNSSDAKTVLDDRIPTRVHGLANAMANAEKFAKAWQRKGGSVADPCECEEIPGERVAE